MRIKITGAALYLGKLFIVILMGYLFSLIPAYLMEPSETSALLSIISFFIGIGCGIYTIVCFWNK